MASLIYPGEEASALRRAALLLERVTEDGASADAEIDLLRTVVGRMQRAVETGQPLLHSTIERMERMLARLASHPAGVQRTGVHELVRRNALAETRELLARMNRSLTSDH